MGLFTTAPKVNANEAAQLHTDGAAVLLDVREPSEWSYGHVDGAIHIPMGQLANRAQDVPTDKPVVVVCRSGNRSGTVTKALIKAGYDAKNMSGGMIAWQRAGHPMVPEGGGVA